MSLRSLLSRLLPRPAPPTPGIWESPRVLDRGRVGRPQIAVDEHGNALAAWHHRGQSEEGIFICRYHADQRSWDLVPRQLDSGRTQAQAPELAMNVRGEMAVVWHEVEGPQTRVCARHMLGAAETWVPYPATLQALPGEVHSLHTAMDLQGNLHAVWCQGIPGAYRVCASGFRADEGAWDPEPRILGDLAEEPLFPQLAVNGAGQGLVVWSTGSGDGEDRLLACHYDPGGRCWSDRPTLVAPGRAVYHRMDLDARGNAVVLWVQEGDRGVRTLQASHLDGATVEWTRAPLLSAGRDILWPQVGLDAQGRAHAVWRQEAAGTVKLFAKRYTEGRWDEHRLPLVEDLGDSQAHALAVNPQGQAVVLWLQRQGGQTTVCLRRHDGRAWSARPLLLGAPGSKAVQSPGAVLAPSGHVAVVWRQGDAEQGAILSARGQA